MFKFEIEKRNNDIKAIGFIPARYASTRLPGKPLIDIAGKPLIQWVWEAASRSSLLHKIVVATDSENIAQVCINMGAEFGTPSELPSGTDRIFFAYNKLQEEADIIINIQGDEPLLTGEMLDHLIQSLSSSSSDVATFVKRITNSKELFEPSVVKVIYDSYRNAIYFSRNAIPYIRDVQPENWLHHHHFWKHIGIYAFKLHTLKKFVELNISKLEKAEKLEQLRLIENGTKILCVETHTELIGVDTPEDIIRVTPLLKNI